MKSKISIIIPVYNVEDYISECLDSVIRQSLEDIEIICFDDGSNDSTVSLIQDYSNRDRRIKLYIQKHAGVSVARNKAINIADGEFIMFIDGDDLLFSDDVLEHMYSKAVQNKAKICGGNVVLFDKDWMHGRRYPSTRNPSFSKEGFVPFLEYGCPYGFTQYIYSKDLLGQDGENDAIRFPHYGCWEDPVFMARAFSKAKIFYALNKNTYCYRRGVHKKEHRMVDIEDLLKASLELMRIGRVNNNHKLQKDTLDVIYSHRLKIMQMVSYNPTLSSQYFRDIKECILDDIKIKNICQIKVLDNEYYYDLEKKQDNLINDLIEKCKDRSVVIYGAGDYGNRLYAFLKDRNIKVLGFAVTDKINHDPQYCGLPVLAFGEWVNMKKSGFSPLFIVAIYDKEVRNETRNIMIEKGVSFADFDLDILEERLVILHEAY